MDSGKFDNKTDTASLSSVLIDLIDNSPLPMAVLDDSRVFRRVNPTFAELTGYRLEDLPTLEDFHARLCPDAPMPALQTGSTPLSLKTSHSATKHVWLHALTVGRFTVLAFVDITASHTAYEELAESESRFRAIVECAPAAIRISRRDQSLYANPSYLKMFGYKDFADLCARPFFDPYTMQSRPLLEDLRRRREAGERGHMEVEVTCRRVDGTEFPVRLFLDGALFPDGPVTIGLLADITEQRRADEEKRRLREQLIQAQKAEAIGRLAGGIAHDFNNLLTVINGYSGMLLSRLNPQTGIYAQIEEIRKAGERAADLTRQLLAFGRKQILEPRVLNLNDVVRDALKAIGGVLPSEIAVTSLLAPDLLRVEADPAQFRQILIDLAINARDAMPQGGTLSIATRNSAAPMRPTPETAAGGAPSHVLLTVTDTGAGMDQHTLDRIFDPFFTTKDMSTGAGLGLSSAYGIVKQSGGEILVSSAPGKGTTVSIYLPVAPALPDVPRELRGTETVLVVEDQPAVRQFTEECLRGYGYNVLSASGGEAAIRLCETFNSIIHVLVTDIVMDELNGLDLAAAVLRLRPQIRVLCVSGYPGTVTPLGTELPPAFAFLQKPFAPAALARKIREILTT